jgi:hypothetical protein
MVREQIIKDTGHHRVETRRITDDGHHFVGYRNDQFAQSSPDNSSPPRGFFPAYDPTKNLFARRLVGI